MDDTEADFSKPVWPANVFATTSSTRSMIGRDRVSIALIVVGVVVGVAGLGLGDPFAPPCVEGTELHVTRTEEPAKINFPLVNYTELSPESKAVVRKAVVDQPISGDDRTLVPHDEHPDDFDLPLVIQHRGQYYIFEGWSRACRGGYGNTLELIGGLGVLLTVMGGALLRRG